MNTNLICWATAACLAVAIPRTSRAAEPDATSKTPRVKPEILRVLEHDDDASTQGLAFHDGLLYESTGDETRSSIRRIDPKDGKLLKTWKINGVFAEGITVIDDSLTLITWRAGRAEVFDLPELKRRATFKYDGEGWGLTSHDGSYFMSNGTNVIVHRDAKFKQKRRLKIKYDGKPLRKINELEYARGMIYANILHSKSIAEIDPETGVVLRVIDCSELRRKAAPKGVDDVLNGIAWMPDTKTFYLTGKNWKHLFEVRIPPAREADDAGE